VPVLCAAGRFLFPKVSTSICRKIDRRKNKPRLFRAGSGSTLKKWDPSAGRDLEVEHSSQILVLEVEGDDPPFQDFDSFERIESASHPMTGVGTGSDANYWFACCGEQRARLSLTKPENPSKIGILEVWPNNLPWAFARRCGQSIGLWTARATCP
jgi:hypothetical protein